MSYKDLRKQISVEVSKLVDKEVVKTIDSTVANKIGYTVIESIRESTKIGKNPLNRGGPRLPAYKHARTPGRYPESAKREFPGKRSRPVNLRLSGAFMESLNYAFRFIKSGVEIEVGYFDRKNADKERGHRDGVNGQPKRPTLPNPNVSKENFNRSIQDKIALILRKHVFNTLRRKKGFK